MEKINGNNPAEVFFIIATSLPYEGTILNSEKNSLTLYKAIEMTTPKSIRTKVKMSATLKKLRE